MQFALQFGGFLYHVITSCKRPIRSEFSPMTVLALKNPVEVGVHCILKMRIWKESIFLRFWPVSMPVADLTGSISNAKEHLVS